MNPHRCIREELCNDINKLVYHHDNGFTYEKISQAIQSEIKQRKIDKLIEKFSLLINYLKVINSDKSIYINFIISNMTSK